MCFGHSWFGPKYVQGLPSAHGAIRCFAIAPAFFNRVEDPAPLADMQRIMQIVSERGRVFRELSQMPGITAYPSNANYILFRTQGAGEVWQQLYDCGILVRDFSRAPMLQDCLRVSIGSPQENDEFLAALREILPK